VIGDPANDEPDNDAQAGQWVIVVRPERGDWPSPFECRLRSWLKVGLRSFGVRCESVQRLTIAEELARSRAECLALAEENAKLRRQLATRQPRKQLAELLEARGVLEQVNALARELGWGQGELDSDIADCLRQTIERAAATAR